MVNDYFKSRENLMLWKKWFQRRCLLYEFIRTVLRQIWNFITQWSIVGEPLQRTYEWYGTVKHFNWSRRSAWLLTLIWIKIACCIISNVNRLVLIFQKVDYWKEISTTTDFSMKANAFQLSFSLEIKLNMFSLIHQFPAADLLLKIHKR